jgi:asparagine synthase (glutamine-hydrolysing)
MYLPDDLLVKVDRCAMSVSLETRAPLLDHRIVSFAASIHIDQKIRNNSGKWLMRNLLYKYVPKSLVERPKMGFMMPLDNWLRGELKTWMMDLIDPSLVKKQGLFNVDVINKTAHNHIKKIENNGYKLWPLLMFQSWYYHNHSEY